MFFIWLYIFYFFVFNLSMYLIFCILLFYYMYTLYVYFIVYNLPYYNLIDEINMFLAACSNRIRAFNITSDWRKARRTFFPTFPRPCNGQRTRSHLGWWRRPPSWRLRRSSPLCLFIRGRRSSYGRLSWSKGAKGW